MAIGAGSVIGALSAGYLIKRMSSVRLFWLSPLLLGIILLLFARQTILWPALIILFLAGLPLGTLSTSVGPILMHIIPQDLMGRVMSVFSTAQTIGMLLSISLSGLLGTLLAGLHLTTLGVTFTTYDTIYLGLGTIFTLAGIYGMINLRGLKVDG
ncbi:MFS transporter [Ktedonosporobacter rubrisoli]|uniref:MFS transporter n=1 Tax=Ktedonosporobacter rubrisoli TaxID=2509675 RepID=A0A4V0Z0D1_KTERU|nr:MFS transporter [Ktedonosporobacter rubrisoli]QBD82801.1 MFS transporter [Ktedonosporobacter rubrisoli]